MDHGPRRSLLFVPASSETMLRKAGSRGADVLILDLEDGVLPGAKDEARARLESLSETSTSDRRSSSCA